MCSADEDASYEDPLLAGLTKPHNPKHLKHGLVQLAEAGDELRVVVQVNVCQPHTDGSVFNALCFWGLTF